MANKRVHTGHCPAPDLDRRRALFRIGSATAAAATALYMAPVVARIDEAEAKGSKRKRGSKRPKMPSKRGAGVTRLRPPAGRP
jgi:hypothetical protein